MNRPHWILPALFAAAAALTSIARAQEKPQPPPRDRPQPADQQGKPQATLAPTWKVGQTWEIAVDLEQAPQPQLGLRGFRGPSLELPGLARSGPREGYAEVARWRLKVVKTKLFAVPGTDDGSAWTGWFVEAVRTDQQERRPTSLTLVFVGPAKFLSDIAVHRPDRKTEWLNFDADAILEAPILPALALLPLAWPDLRVPTPQLERKGHRGERVLQRHTTKPSGIYFELRGAAGAEVGRGERTRVKVRWRPGEPWPAKISGEGFEVRLTKGEVKAR